MNEQVIELLFEGVRPSEIAERTGLHPRKVYRLLKQPSKDYEPPTNVTGVWVGCRARACQLLFRLGIRWNDIANYLGVHPSTVYRLLRYPPAGTPIVRVEITADAVLSNGELLRAGFYRAFDISREGVCLRNEEEDRLHFIDDAAVLRGHVRVCESEG